MSRRKMQWKKSVRRAGGDLSKVLPSGATGQGTYLTKKSDVEGMTPVAPGTGRGNTCSLPLSPRKAQLVQQWCK